MNKHKSTQVSPPSNATDKDEDATSRLIPPEITRILNERPLMPHEDPDRFDALLTELILSYDPKDTVEYILIKDLADAQWQANRYRSMRQAAIQLALPDTAWMMLEGSYIATRKALTSDPAPPESPSADDPEDADKAAEDEGEDEQDDENVEEDDPTPPPHFHARSDITRMIRHAMQGDASARQELEEIMTHAGVTYDMLHTSALLRSIKSITALEEMLIHADKRRDQLMGMIQARRHVNDVMAKSLLKSRKHGHPDDVVEDNS